MAVLIEGLATVIKCQSVIEKYMGGVEAFMRQLPNSSLVSDGELACISFMVPVDVKSYVEHLIENGLIFKQSDAAIDIVVVDQQKGMTTRCDWVDFGESIWNDPNQKISVCSARPTKVNKIFVPENWVYEKSLSANFKYIEGEHIPETLKFVRSEDGLDVLLDEKTGEKFYIRRS